MSETIESKMADAGKWVEDHDVTKTYLDHHMKYSATFQDGLIEYSFEGNRYFFESYYNPLMKHTMYELSFKVINTEEAGWVSNDYKRTTRKL
jgi:hypothetical protein